MRYFVEEIGRRRWTSPAKRSGQMFHKFLRFSTAIPCHGGVDGPLSIAAFARDPQRKPSCRQARAS